MFTTAGIWLLILCIVLAFMSIKDKSAKAGTQPERRAMAPPPIPRPRPVTRASPVLSQEQRLTQLQAEYQRNLALLQRAITDPAYRRMAEQELYARYLKHIKEWLG
jgi:type IV secretory pathway VirB10-like protein